MKVINSMAVRYGQMPDTIMRMHPLIFLLNKIVYRVGEPSEFEKEAALAGIKLK